MELNMLYIISTHKSEFQFINFFPIKTEDTHHGNRKFCALVQKFWVLFPKGDPGIHAAPMGALA